MERVPLGNPVMRYRSMLIFPLRKLRSSCLHKHHEYTQIAIALKPDEYSRQINDVWWVSKENVQWQILTSLCQVCIRQTNDQLTKFRPKSFFEISYFKFKFKIVYCFLFTVLVIHTFNLFSSATPYIHNIQLPSYLKNFLEPHWKSMGPPEISRATWQVWSWTYTQVSKG